MVAVLQAYRFALDPTARQQGSLASHTGAARFAYNWGLELVATRLDVLPTNVVDEDRHWGQAVERGVWSPVIVEPQPPSQGTAALGVGVIQPRVGPLIEQGLVEPLHLAIGLGR
jgi:Helix-turn-helix domain